MCGMLDTYLSLFARLRVDRNKNSWTGLTNHASPYKPLLLLSATDLIASGEINSPFIELSQELSDTFQRYISLLPPMSRKAIIAYPFFYLKSSGFWHLKPKEHSSVHTTISSADTFRKHYYGAEIDKELFPLLKMQTSRGRLREVLIQKYFAREIQDTIRSQSFTNFEATRYSNELLHTPQDILPEAAEILPTYEFNKPIELKKEKVRDQGFRKAIVKLYDHRCALCGIKMLTDEGHTIVDAAHIIPWSESHDDQPTNGMALCKLCHWSFDKGLMSVDGHYQVLISKSIQNDPNLPGHMMTLADRPIFRPQQSRFWPNQENFEWHRKERFQTS